MENSRRKAAFVVARWLMTHEYPSAALPSGGADRAFVQDLVYTTIRRLRPLRRILGELVRQWPKGELEALLYVGAAQVLYMSDVPDFAAVHETVSAAKSCGNPAIAKVVNGVLRNLIRRRAEFEALLAAASVDERESLPGELYRRWVSRFGAADAERIAIWHNQPAETYLARADGTFTVLARGARVTEVAGYESGDFIVQDPATALAVRLVDPQPDDLIFDACAAPGGKTIQMAWRGAHVTACEVNPRRRRTLMANLTRTRLDGCVRVVESLDAASSVWPAGVDAAHCKAVVDAPCSNTGVLRRRPDARWNWSVEKLQSLVKLQAEILDRVASLLPVGGRLVYSTCSNEPEENDEQISAFCARHPEFICLESHENVPFQSGTDGAFAAALIKK